MTDEQIVKALECCGNNGWCSDCPYYKSTSTRGVDCYNDLMLDALDLIKRQQAEIKVILKLVKRQQAEIEDLEKQYNSCAKRFYKEGIKDFAEQVKMAFYAEFDEIIPSVMADKIDDIVKEMTEEEK